MTTFAHEYKKHEVGLLYRKYGSSKCIKFGKQKEVIGLNIVKVAGMSWSVDNIGNSEEQKDVFMWSIIMDRQFENLRKLATIEVIEQGGRDGMLFTDKITGDKVFMPFCGNY